MKEIVFNTNNFTRQSFINTFFLLEEREQEKVEEQNHIPLFGQDHEPVVLEKWGPKVHKINVGTK